MSEFVGNNEFGKLLCYVFGERIPHNTISTMVVCKQISNAILSIDFHTARFGIHEAHGKGQAIQLNFLWDGRRIYN